MSPKIVFFSRSYQSVLFPLLTSSKYESIHVTLTNKEKALLESKGIIVDYCFESFVGSVDNVEEDYLCTSLLADRFLKEKSFDERIAFLKKEIAFWREIFNKYLPIAVLNEIVAIEIAEVMYIEAKRKGIRYLAWMSNPINEYFYWVDNPTSLSFNPQRLLITPSENSIKIANEYIDRIINKNEKPYYILPYLNRSKIYNLKSSIKGLIKILYSNFINGASLYENYTESSFSFFKRSYKSFFLKYNDIEDINEKEIILYPLHYEPEASIDYLSEFFSNQVALIENLSKCLKLSQLLVVKEHPTQPGMLLTKRFQDLLKKNPKLLFLPSTISSYEIIKKSKLIVTLTSHLGWEALILGKPVFVLGKMFYDQYPYINRFSSFEKLRHDIHHDNYIYPQKEATIYYVAKILEFSYKGKPFPCESLYNKDNINDILYAIEKELNLI